MWIYLRVLWLISLFPVSQGWNQDVSRAPFLSGSSGEESASMLIQIVGRNQFLVAIGLGFPPQLLDVSRSLSDTCCIPCLGAPSIVKPAILMRLVFLSSLPLLLLAREQSLLLRAHVFRLVPFRQSRIISLFVVFCFFLWLITSITSSKSLCPVTSPIRAAGIRTWTSLGSHSASTLSVVLSF